MRAVELADAHDLTDRLSSRFRTNYGEVAGWKGEETIPELRVEDADGEVRIDHDVPLNLDSPSWLAGFLARVIHDHKDVP